MKVDFQRFVVFVEFYEIACKLLCKKKKKQGKLPYVGAGLKQKWA